MSAPTTPLPIPSWDELFMREVYAIARKSKDPRSKIGAVLVYWPEKDPFARGYNDFPRRVLDRIPSRWERPEKYSWVCHAEVNSILNCARTGRPTKGSVMFTQGVPCADCTKSVIQAGIIEIVVHKQWQHYEQEFNWEKWNQSSAYSTQMLLEANIPVRVLDQELGVDAVLDGKVIKV
jgi:dCMP deaminase